MNARVLIVALALLGCACGTGSSAPATTPSAVDGFDTEWPRVATMGSGTAAYARGSWAYEDYVYDTTAGASGNSGDLAILQIALTPDAVRYVAKLSSYVAEDPTLIALAVDTDCDDATGGGEWPNGSGVTTPGWEFLVQAGDLGASVLRAGQPPVPIVSAANHATNVIEFDVPRSVADPAGRHWCYRGLMGLGSETWAQTTNVLFRNRTFDQGTANTDENESADTFQTDKQVAALNSGDFTEFRREVDFALIASGAAFVPEPPAGNLAYTRIYDTPDFPNALPEGARQGENTIRSPLYNGRFQPYTMYVPQTYRDNPAPAAFLPLLHGITANHRNHGWTRDDGAFWKGVVEANRILVAMPFGRGEESWYEHVGEVDVLAVIADVKRHFNVDESRQFLGGASMGGLGALKIAQEHPDLFAGLILSVPPMSDRTQGYAAPENNDYDLVELAGSLRNIPVLDFYGELDPIVPPAVNSERFCDELAALSFAHDCWLDATGSHSSFYNPRAEQIADLLLNRNLERDPAHVTYRMHPRFRRQAAQAGVASLLPYDSAYWIRGISYPALAEIETCTAQTPNNGDPCTFPVETGTEDSASIATIDVRSYGSGIGEPVANVIGDDPSPSLTRRGLSLSPGAPIEPRNAFDLNAENVTAFNLDLARMSLTLGQELTAQVSGAGTITLGLLSAGTAACRATLDGAPVPLTRGNGRIVLALTLPASPAPLSVRCTN